MKDWNRKCENGNPSNQMVVMPPDEHMKTRSQLKALNQRDGFAPCIRTSPSKEAFTIVELLVVISIIALLAGLVVGLAGMASSKSKEARVRAEMNQLIADIDGYYAVFRQYPPDNVIDPGKKTVNPHINQLYYELTGTVVKRPDKDKDDRFVFEIPGSEETLPAQTVLSLFHAEGFINAAMRAAEIRYKASFRSSQRRRINPPPTEVLAIPVDWPKGVPNPAFPSGSNPELLRINPWRYVSTNPTNNPGSYDLWAEYVIGRKTNVIGNWSRETIVLGR